MKPLPPPSRPQGKTGKALNPRGGIPLAPYMTRSTNSRWDLLDRLANPTEFLIRSWVTTVAILGVIAILVVGAFTLVR